MRTISDATIAKLAERVGIEPIYFIEVYWDTDIIGKYGDRAIPEYQIQGRILEMSGIENVINVANSSSSSSVSIKLDDTDSYLKNIFDYRDIHKTKVEVYLWFTNTAYTDKILLFTGEISSPIVWSESERTFSFDILTTIQTREVGISLESGNYPTMPAKLVGKTIPTIFGTVIKLPGLLIDEIKNGDEETSGENVLEEEFGLEDPTLQHEVNKSAHTAQQAAEIARGFFILYLKASFTARKLGEVGELEPIEHGKGKFSGLAKQYLDQGNKFLIEAQKVNKYSEKLEGTRQAQRQYNKQNIRVTNADKFPPNVQLNAKINNAEVKGYFADKTTFVISEATHPNAQRVEGIETVLQDYYANTKYKPIITRDDFFYADAGTRFYVTAVGGDENEADNNLAIRYIIAYGTVSVIGVYAKKLNKFGQKHLTPVPSKYYSILFRSFGGLGMTVCRMPKPLSMRIDQTTGELEGWEDDVWFTVTGSSGDVVNLMISIIVNYTNLSYDSVSFEEARPYLTRVNFALTDRKDAFQFLQELAYQSRCAIWIKNGVFHLKYLGRRDTVVDTITESDIIFGSLELTTTESEDIVTKYIAEWQPNYKVTEKYKLIVRYNINVYGLTEETYDYYAFNQAAVVFNAATFWVIRTAHIFKRLRFRTSLSKIKLETFDTVNLAFTSRYVANGTVIGIIESAEIDSDSFEIEFMVWVPVLLGEMEEFDFAFPSDLTVGQIFPRRKDVDKNRPGDPGPASGGAQPTDPDVSNPFSGGNENNGFHVGFGTRKSDWPDFNGGNFTQPPAVSGTAIVTSTIVPKGPPPKATTEYQYQDFDLNPNFDLPLEETPIIMPGTIKSGSGDTYTVNCYDTGLDGALIEIENVKQLDIADGEDIPNGTWVYVIRNIYTDEQDNVIVEHTIQVPIWL